MMFPKNTLLVDPGRGFVSFPLLVCSFRFTLQSYGPKSTQGQTLTTLVCAHGCIIFRSFGQGSFFRIFVVQFSPSTVISVRAAVRLLRLARLWRKLNGLTGG